MNQPLKYTVTNNRWSSVSALGGDLAKSDGMPLVTGLGWIRQYNLKVVAVALIVS